MASEEEAFTKLEAWRTAEHRNGTDTELLTILGASMLFVLCGDRFTSSQVGAGDFSLRTIRCTDNPASMATCMVGDHQWLLARDSMALRVRDRSFLFALPGLLYGLVLADVGRSDQQFKMLEDIFGRFCAYHDLVGVEGTDPVDPIPEPDDWTHAYSAVLKLASRSNTKIATTNLPEPSAALGDAAMGAKMAAAKIQKAMRMSAAVKLLSRALLRGALRPTDHLHMSFVSAVARTYPTMWAIANLLDAIEYSTPPDDVVVGRATPQGFWGFKEEGLGLLLEVVRAYGSATNGPAAPRGRGHGLRRRSRKRGGFCELDWVDVAT